MRKWLIGAAVVVLVLVAGVLVALRNLNGYLNDNKAWLEQQAESALGRPVSFDEVGVSLSGGLGAQIENLHIGDDPRYSSKDFVRADRVDVLLRILPALLGRYEIRRVVLAAPAITLIRDRHGFNFESLGRAAGAKDAGAAAANRTGGAARTGGGVPLAVSNLSVRDASIRWVDRRSSQPSEARIDRLDLTASGDEPSQPVQLEVAAALLGAEEQNLSVTGSLGPIRPGIDPQSLRVDLTVDLGPLVPDRLREVEEISRVLPAELSSPGPVHLHAKASGELGALDVEARLGATNAAVNWASFLRKPSDVALELSFAGAWKDGTAVVRSAALQLDGLRVEAAGTIDTSRQPPAADLQIQVPRSELSGLTRVFPALEDYSLQGRVAAALKARGPIGLGVPALTGSIELDDAGVKATASELGLADLTTTLELEGDSVVVSPADIRLAGVPARIEARIRGFQRPQVDFQVDVPELPLAAIGAGGKTGREEAVRDLKVAGRALLGKDPVGMLATVTSREGTARDVGYRDLQAALSLQNGVLLLRRLQVSSLGGSLAARGQVDLRPVERPPFEMHATTRDVDVRALLQAASSDPPSLKGRLAGKLNLEGAGEQWDMIRPTLDGDGRIEVRDGVLEDVNIAESVLSGLTGIRGLTQLISANVRDEYPEIFRTGDTRFDELGATLRIHEQRVRTDDLRLSARDYSVDATGSFGFDGSADLNATFVASQKLTDDLLRSVKEARVLTDERGRLAIPFRLRGRLPNVKPKPDTEFVADSLRRALLDGGLDRLLRGKPKEGATPGAASPAEKLIEKGLKGLFGR
jgi:autotransporter translocation and assembly factor TamB